MRRAHYNYLLALGLLSLVGCQPYDGGSSSAGLFGASANMLVAVPSVSGTLTTTVGASSTLSVSFLTDQTNPIISLSISGLSALPSGWSASGASTCTLAFRSSGCNLRLTYAPSAVTRGTLTLSYRYSSKFGGIHSDSLTIPYAATTDNNVVASAAPSGAVNAVLGSGSQSVAVTFTTDDGNAATALALTSDLSSLPSGWTSSGASFSCASLASGNGCQLPLTYAPSSVGSGILTLNYSYIDNAGQSKTGALNIPYASTSSNNVVGTASPSGQIAVSAGGNQSVAVTFTTDDGNAATALALTSDLSSLPSGWTSSAPSFSCASVSTGNGCQLALTYAPSAVASGTLSLAYTYTDNAGEAKSGYVNIPYIGTTHDHVIGTASPSGQLSVSVNASQAVSVTFTTDDGNAATNLSVTSDLSSLPSGWTSGAGNFSCASVSTGSGCQLSLTYAPPAAATGTLNLNYSYTNNAGTVMSGTVNIPYVASAGIGGAVSGLSGTLVLQDNGGDNLSLSSNGSFTFATPLEAGAPYSVSVLSQPTGQTCTVASGSGTVSTDVSNVAVSCTVNTYSIGGTISGLTQSGLALTDNGGDSLSPAAGASSFTFATPLAYGSGYTVAVSTQPTGQTCTVASGSGTVTGTVASVAISCSTNTYSIGGSISGLTQSGLMLTDNGGNATSISSGSSSFTFSNQIAYGNTYSVAVSAQPTGETCTVASGSGTVTGTVASVAISCSTNTYSIGGSISGLTQSGLMLTDNGGNTTPIASGSTSFTFSSQIAYGNTYAVAVSAQPTGQTCTVASGSGTVTGTVASVAISCSTNTYSIGGSISGLTQSGLMLTDNGGNATPIASGSTSFTFSNHIAYGSGYAVAVSAQPTGETCTVASGSGTVTGTVASVAISCSTNTYSIGGSVSGLTAAGLTLTDNGGNATSIPSGSTSFAFSNQIAYGSGYAVAVSAQPTGQSCTVASGSGTVTGTVSSVSISCVNSYTIGGTISGLTMSSVVLATGSQTVTVSSGSSTWVFPNPFASGTSYSVSVQLQPAGEFCQVTSGASGTLISNVSNVTLVCTPTYGYSYSKAITVKSGQVSGGPLTNYPFLLSSTDPDLATVVNGGKVTSANGDDIIFVALDDTTCGGVGLSPCTLNFENESYNAATGQLITWVNVPSISSSTVIYIYFGNSSITTSQAQPTSVWDSHYALVSHLANGTTLNTNDSTANGNNGTTGGVTATTGKIDGGAASASNSDSICYGTAASLANFTQLTYEFWMKPSVINGFPAGRSNFNAIRFTGSSPYVLTYRHQWSGATSWSGSTALSTGNWYFVVVTYDGSSTSNKPQIYINGVPDTMTTTTAPSGTLANDGTTPLCLANYGVNTNGNAGTYDEFRYSNTVRSSGWVTTEYNNESAPSSFYTLGSTVTMQ